MAKSKNIIQESLFNQTSEARNVGLIKTFYLPIHRDNIYEYFSKGLFCPLKYQSIDRTYSDLQSLTADYLIISKIPVKEESINYCNIELLLTDQEIQKYCVKHDDFFYYGHPIPVSRVKAILVESLSDKEEILIKASNESTGPLPSDNFTINSNFTSIQISSDNNTSILGPVNFIEAINKFDKILGAIALIKNADYFFPSTGEISTYSEEYVVLIDRLINRENAKKIDAYYLPLIEEDAGEITLFSDFFTYFHDTSIISKDNFINYINTTKYLEDRNDIKSALMAGLEILDSALYESKLKSLSHSDQLVNLMIRLWIYLYNNQDIDALEGFIASLDQKLKPKLGKACLLLLGWYHGYNKLRPKIKLEAVSENKNFSGKIDLMPFMKFPLNDSIDFSVIESTYQQTILKHKIALDFGISLAVSKYSQDEIFELRYSQLIVNPEPILNGGVINYKYKALTLIELIKLELDKYKEKISERSYIYTYCRVNGLNREFSYEKDKTIGDISFDKDDLITHIESLNNKQQYEFLVLLQFEQWRKIYH